MRPPGPLGFHAVDGVQDQESWSFYEDVVPYDQYMSQSDRFTASRHDPRAWAKLFARAGARYAALTSPPQTLRTRRTLYRGRASAAVTSTRSTGTTGKIGACSSSSVRC